MAKLDYLIGKTISRWTILSFSHYVVNQPYYKCLCSCGSVKFVSGYSLNAETSKSCGCNQRKHGDYRTSEFAAWREIRYRCYTKTCRAYKHYGARGISVCDRWMESYSNFISDMGRKPSPLHSLDRIDNNGDYSPENCKWSTHKEQMNNTRTTKIVEFNGVTHPLSVWATMLNIKHKSLSEGLRRGKNGMDYYVSKYGLNN